MKVASLFRPGTRAFWGTTYGFGLALFDQYLLRQLGGPPLNAVLLADHSKLSEIWNGLDPREHYLARHANRVYLLRGIQLPGGGAFHPKTYLFVRRDEVTLIVGSGNLSRQGIDAGKEVFTSFDTSTELGIHTLRAWAGWISRLVDGVSDAMLTRRFIALREQCPWMVGPVGPTPFASNEHRPLLDRFIDQLPGPVDELHVAAAYYDRDAQALAEALERIQPKALHLYYGSDTSVHGPSLAQVIAETDREVHLRRFEPSRFVHAKLIAAVSGGAGVLLCGSPNLSRAALTLTYADAAHGNCEIALIRPGSADQVRAPFLTSGLDLVSVGSAELHGLAFQDDHEPNQAPEITLRRAGWREDGRIEVTTQPPVRTGFSLTWRDGQAELDGQITTEAQADRDQPPILVWLTDEAGDVASNAAAIDDPNALDRSLASRDPSRDRPSGLQEQDAETPLGQLMSWVHARCIFDIDDTPAARRAQSAQDSAPEEESTDFWDRLMAEELSYDHRAPSYRSMSHGILPLGHDLFRELEIMLALAPRDNPVLRLVSGNSAGTSEPEGEHTGVTWSLAARERVRVVNVLSRWCRAVSDPRHALLRPDAPAANYQGLLTVLTTAWAEAALDEDRLTRLAGELFGAFLGDGKSPGFLGRADHDLRETALDQLDDAVREWAAGLAYLALRPDRPWKAIVYEWQPYLRTGLIDTDAMIVGEQTVALAERVLGYKMTAGAIEDVLLARADYLDEAKWCENLARALGLRKVALKTVDNRFVSLRISLQDISAPLTDPRVVEAALQAMRFRKVGAIGIETADLTIVLQPGHRVWVKARGGSAEGTVPSNVIFTDERLAAVERQGGALSELLGLTADVA